MNAFSVVRGLGCSGLVAVVGLFLTACSSTPPATGSQNQCNTEDASNSVPADAGLESVECHPGWSCNSNTSHFAMVCRPNAGQPTVECQCWEQGELAHVFNIAAIDCTDPGNTMTTANHICGWMLSQ